MSNSDRPIGRDSNRGPVDDLARDETRFRVDGASVDADFKSTRGVQNREVNADGSRNRVSSETQAGVTIRRNDDGTIATQARGGVDLKIGGPRGSLDVGAGGQVTIEGGVTRDERGTRYTVAGDASYWIKAGADAKAYGVSGRLEDGMKARYEVTVPPQSTADPRTINPFDPSSMPPGAAIRFNAAEYTNTEFNLKIKALSTESRVRQQEGVGVLIEKTGDHTVRVTAGPNGAIDAFQATGFDYEAAKLKLGRDYKETSATIRTAEFDLSTTAGREAYGRFITGGEMPQRNAHGVDKVSAVQTFDASSKPSISAQLGPLAGRFDGAKSTLSDVLTTHGDGSSERRELVQIRDGNPLTIDRKHDAQGKQIGETAYTFTITPRNELEKRALNLAYTGDAGAQAADRPFKAGQATTLRFTESELGRTLDAARQARTHNPHAPGLDLLDGMQPRHLAIGLATGVIDDTALKSIASYASGANPRSTGYTRLPGTVDGMPALAVSPGGPETRQAPAASLLPLTSDQHPDHALFRAIRDKAPTHISDAQVAQAVVGAREGQITAERLDKVVAVGSDLWIVGKIDGYRAKVDLSQPPASPDDINARLSKLSSAAPLNPAQEPHARHMTH